MGDTIMEATIFAMSQIANLSHFDGKLPRQSSEEVVRLSQVADVAAFRSAQEIARAIDRLEDGHE